MKRDVRSTVLALATSGLVVVGSAACSSQEMVDAVSGDSGNQTTETSTGGEAQTLSGEMEYLAPGELVINDQAFFVAEDTQILGGVSACPADDGVDEDGYGIVDCTLEELEATLQEGTVVFAEVEMAEDGIAESITEYEQDSPEGTPEDGSEDGTEDGSGDEAPEETGGFTGTVSGELEYLAPGEYIINDQAFYVSEDTQITAGIYACTEGVQDPDTGNVTCDFDEFDATLANGTVILAEVEIVDGIAESITEHEA